ncbi:MAG: ImmA/IrrE family metallo-endopeptidase [bacterium]|nr:ImmA/IrrE family metallo-endopeptidase [bacterium]
MPLDGLELNPSLIGQNIAAARRSCNLNQADLARAIGVSRPTLIAIESGQRTPSPIVLAAIAAELRVNVRDLAVLPPPDVQSAVRFRDPLRNNEPAEPAYRALVAFGRTYRFLEEKANIRFRPRSVPPVLVDEVEDVDLAAETLAASERARLSLGDGPIVDLRGVLEQDAGILVFALPQLAETKGILGLFVFSNELPLVGFNPRQPDYRRQQWTLAHEYAHFLTNRFDLEITSEVDARKSRRKHEQFAEAFAANFLLPTSGVSRRVAELLSGAKSATVAQILLLADQFRVSFQAMCKRLESLGRIPKGTYEYVIDRGFRPIEAERSLGIERRTEALEPYPVRFIYMLASLRRSGSISEGDVVNFLQTDRLTARSILDAFEIGSAFPLDAPLEGKF